MSDLSHGEVVLLIVLIWATWIIFYCAGENNLLGYMSDTISDFGKQLSESTTKTKEEAIPMEKNCVCSVCGHEFAIMKDSVYLAQEKSTLFERMGGNEPTVFNAIDCPNCSCQMILKERVPKIVLVVPPIDLQPDLSKANDKEMWK